MRSKRILSLVLALVMVLGTFGTVFAAPTDNDKVDWLIEEGLVQGYGDGTYGLDKAITRAEVSAMVVRALDLEEIAKASAGFASPFTDMNTPAVMWARGYVTVTAGQGIVEGYPNGEFRPANPITYAEISAMMVRLMGGLTEAEEANAVWPTTYLAKAVQLGVFDGVNGITDYNAPATREKVFEMIYNAIISKQIGNYTIVKAIVLENYRVERLAKDEVVVEVIKEVQRSNQLSAAEYGRGDQEKLVIDAKVGDVEDLLGKVADFTLDKDGKVIKVTIDETYKIEVASAKAIKNKFGGYTVELGERYDGSDERIYRTYYNNEAYNYAEFFSQDVNNRTEFNVDYAKVTVKNGKVLFIDAFNFVDIAPVKEIKGDGAEVWVYNDFRDGAIKKYNVAASKDILLVQFGRISVGTREDIQVNDVIHEYDGGFIINKESAVTGEFEKVSEARNGDVFVHVDGEEYLVSTDDYKKPVYSFETNNDFWTLIAGRAAGDLREFRGETVTVLIDLSGNLQFLGSEIELGEFVGLVTRVVGRDIRVLKTDNKQYDYYANLDTKVDGTTGHSSLNDLRAGDLVFMSVDGEVIRQIHNFTKTPSRDVTALTTRQIDLANPVQTFRILNETNIFVSQGGVYSAKTAKEVADAFAKDNDVEGYVINGDEWADFTRRDNLAPRITEAHTIVLTKIAIERSANKEIVEFTGYADSQETLMRVILADGTRETREVVATGYPTLVGGDIIEIEVTKDDNKDILKVTRLIENNKNNVWEVLSATDRNNLVVEDAVGNVKTRYITSDTKVFSYGKDLLSAKRVKVSLDGNYLRAVLVMADTAIVTENLSGAPVTTGVVTYIDVPVKLGSDVVAKVVLPASNTDVYKVVAYKSDGTVAGTVSTLISKDVTATELGITSPGTENATYVVRTYKVVDGNDVELSNKVVKNVDLVNPIITSTDLDTDNTIAETATIAAGKLTVNAVDAETAGNGKTLTLVDPSAANATSSIVVSGNDVTVNLATDSASNITTTWKQVADLVNADSNANQLIDVVVTDAADNDDAATAVGTVTTTGGVDAVDAVFTLEFDVEMREDLAATVTIDGKVYNATVTWSDPNTVGFNDTAELTITADQFTANDTLDGEDVTATSLVKASGNAVDFANSTDVTID